MSEQDADGVRQALLAGRQTFMDVELLVASGCIVPRPETQLLGRTALKLLEQIAAASPGFGLLRVIDICCGSGNLACALAAGVPRARIWACDLSAPCVELAGSNVERLALGARVSVHRGDLFAPLGGEGLAGSVDLIVCNPPYISTGRLGKDRAHLLALEPREAFDGGPFGISTKRRAINEARSFLRSGGWLLLEIGLGQDRQTAQLFERAEHYERSQPVENPQGEVRVMMARKR